jgi:hypothetical protein
MGSPHPLPSEILATDSSRIRVIGRQEVVTMARSTPKKHVRAAAETLRNIASQVRGKAAKQLQGSESLADDLGYDDREFENLAVWQRQVGNTLRTDDGQTRILASHLKEKRVRQVLGETLQRSIGAEHDDDELDLLISEAKETL